MTFFTSLDAWIIRLISIVFKKDSHQRAIHQFVKFGVIGVVNTFIDFAIYYLLTRFTGLRESIYIANVISFTIAVTFSYFANRTWTFSMAKKAGMGEAVKFYSTAITGFLINISILFIGVHVFGFFDLFAKLIATIIVIMWNFFVNKFWVFKTKQL